MDLRPECGLYVGRSRGGQDGQGRSGRRVGTLMQMAWERSGQGDAEWMWCRSVECVCGDPFVVRIRG